MYRKIENIELTQIVPTTGSSKPQQAIYAENVTIQAHDLNSDHKQSCVAASLLQMSFARGILEAQDSLTTRPEGLNVHYATIILY